MERGTRALYRETMADATSRRLDDLPGSATVAGLLAVAPIFLSERSVVPPLGPRK